MQITRVKYDPFTLGTRLFLTINKLILPKFISALLFKEEYLSDVFILCQHKSVSCLCNNAFSNRVGSKVNVLT